MKKIALVMSAFALLAFSGMARAEDAAPAKTEKTTKKSTKKTDTAADGAATTKTETKTEKTAK
jgi:hypothetical protein